MSEEASYPIEVMCRVLEVSRSGYYAWRVRGRSRRDLENEALLTDIWRIYLQNRKVYGSPRVYEELKDQGMSVGRHRVARLMRDNGIQSRRRKKWVRPRTGGRMAIEAPNVLARSFTAARPDEVWVSDITYIPTLEGWMYCAVVLDLYSRKVVGWSVSPDMRNDVAVEALQRALVSRKPKPRELLHHSDRGIQYASLDYQELLKRTGITSSMSRPGCCLDNAVAESFFSTLKMECIRLKRYRNRHEATLDIESFIEYYNTRRRHSTIGYQAPESFEKRTSTNQLPVH
jgi:transposase InsO family protein